MPQQLLGVVLAAAMRECPALLDSLEPRGSERHVHAGASDAPQVTGGGEQRLASHFVYVCRRASIVHA